MENFQQGLNAENWDEFSEKSHLTYGIYAGGKMMLCLCLKKMDLPLCRNLILHNAIMEQLETEK